MTRLRMALFTAAAGALTACTEPPITAHTPPLDANPSVANGVAEPLAPSSTVRWNRFGIGLFRVRGGGGVGRIQTYLSIAQYRAVQAALNLPGTATVPLLAGASAGASIVVLKQFYPLDAAAVDAEFAAQRAWPHWNATQLAAFDAGTALGIAHGEAVLVQASTDNVGATDPGVPPVGPGYWTSATPTIRGNYGARPFFLRSQDELRSPPPPAFGSPQFLNALGDVHVISTRRTPEQIAIVLKWVPFSLVVFNDIATDLIVRYRRTELEATRVLAYGNAAAFDAIIACFDTKFAYWFIRPTQADPAITLATPLPNHPSYPSAHSCETGAFQEVLGSAFPSERAALAAIANEASMSRIFGGLHYKFDGDAGLVIGRSAGRLALQRKGLE